MAARNESKAKAAIERLLAEGLGTNAGRFDYKCSHRVPTVCLGLGEVIWLKLDLASPRQTKEAAEYILSREKRLDILSTPLWLISDVFSETD